MKKALIILAMSVILICFVQLAYYVGAEGFSRIQPLRTDEAYRIYTEEQVPREDLSLYLVTDERIFLYYDYEGVINVYSLEGNFLFGLQIQSLRNGTGDIAFSKGFLYIKARGNTIYIFDDMTLVSSFDRADNPNEYIAIELLMNGAPCHEVDGVKYYAAGNEIVKSESGYPLQTVISLPKKNKSVYYLGIGILLVIAGLMHYIGYLKKKYKV